MHTREIPLTQGQITTVDDADYDFLIQWKWYALYYPGNKKFYAVRNQWKHEIPEGGKKQQIAIHRLLMGITGKTLIDHINRDTLDNRRENLRVASYAQNAQNRSLVSTNKSGYKGVYWVERLGKWRAIITAYGKQMHLGYFDDLNEAVDERKRATLELHGDFANIDY